MGLKIRRPSGHGGSTPPPGTNSTSVGSVGSNQNHFLGFYRLIITLSNVVSMSTNSICVPTQFGVNALTPNSCKDPRPASYASNNLQRRSSE
jgi:hypothetical protein